ncbi:MAG: aldose epimerase family protein [Alphaproteobacteria bacterium]
MGIARRQFGSIGGVGVEALTLDGGAGVTATLITHGARLTELWVPDRSGVPADIVLGFDEVDAYAAHGRYSGAVCGRYGNRIAGARFRLGGQSVTIDANEAPNHLHGGFAGFDLKVWAAETDAAANAVRFTAVSEDGEGGFPGRLDLAATYSLDGDRLAVVMEATTDRPTPINMVQHAYFNLAGHGAGDIGDHMVQLHGAFVTPVDDALLPTGEIRTVAGTPFDFTRPRRLGDVIDTPGLTPRGGFDNNWVLGAAGADGLRPCADIRDPASGRRLELATTEPGVQFYTAAHLGAHVTGKGGVPYCRFAGFTLETQAFPDTPNQPHFPSCLLVPGAPYRHAMRFRFSAG